MFRLFIVRILNPFSPNNHAQSTIKADTRAYHLSNLSPLQSVMSLQVFNLFSFLTFYSLLHNLLCTLATYG